MKKDYFKEGQYNGAVGAIITLIIGVGISVLLMILVGSMGGQTYQLLEADIDSIGHKSVSEIFLALNGSTSNLNASNLVNGSLSVINNSEPVGLGNFTIDYIKGNLILINETYNNSNMSAAFTWDDYAIRTPIREGIINSFSALEQTGKYLPIIVLAVVISLVMVLIVGFASFGKGNGGGSTAL